MLKYSLNLVFRSKLRTFLTSLGITIAVILLSMIIFGMNGFKDVITGEFTSRFKPNEIIISKSGFNFLPSTPDETSDEEKKTPTTITPEVIDEIIAIPGVESVQPAIMINGMQIRIKEEKNAFTQSFVFGWNVPGDSSYFAGFKGDKNTLANGEAFVSEDVVNFYKLTDDEIIGKSIVLEVSEESLLSNRTKNQIDKKYEYKVVGVIQTGADRTDGLITVEDSASLLASNGGFVNRDEYLNTVGFDQIYLVAEGESQIEEIKEKITNNYNLQTYSADDILEFLSLITTAITLILVFFGVVSAFVASIGIINTMVMSIYEQTREIGINKAVGASNRQVMVIFLIQSGMIGLLGGLLGLGIVITVTTLADPFIVDLIQKEGFSADNFFTFQPLLVLGIILGCILVGVLAGIYPAVKAARLDPVKALRYE